MKDEKRTLGGQHRGEYVYDTLEEIQGCLNCTKEKCTNCLEYKKERK